jgi:hypothetical protein
VIAYIDLEPLDIAKSSVLNLRRQKPQKKVRENVFQNAFADLSDPLSEKVDELTIDA